MTPDSNLVWRTKISRAIIARLIRTEKSKKIFIANLAPESCSMLPKDIWRSYAFSGLLMGSPFVTNKTHFAAHTNFQSFDDGRSINSHNRAAHNGFSKN